MNAALILSLISPADVQSCRSVSANKKATDGNESWISKRDRKKEKLCDEMRRCFQNILVSVAPLRHTLSEILPVISPLSPRLVSVRVSESVWAKWTPAELQHLHRSSRNGSNLTVYLHAAAPPRAVFTSDRNETGREFIFICIFIFVSGEYLVLSRMCACNLADLMRTELHSCMFCWVQTSWKSCFLENPWISSGLFLYKVLGSVWCFICSVL